MLKNIRILLLEAPFSSPKEASKELETVLKEGRREGGFGFLQYTFGVMVKSGV